MFEVKIKIDKVNLHFKSPNEDDQMKNELIDRAFRLVEPVDKEEHKPTPLDVASALKVKVTNKNEREREPKNTEKSIPKPDLHSAPAKSPQENQEDQENEKVDQRSRRLPLLGKNHAISEPVDYRENCQCHIDCPDCEFIGKTEVKFGFRYTFCPDFNSKLFLRPAADQWGEEDLEGNVYLAEQQFQESRAQ